MKDNHTSCIVQVIIELMSERKRRAQHLLCGVQGRGCRTYAWTSLLCRFQPSSATSVAKCRQLMSLCPSLLV
ncbi:hypothetical protein ATANTOWER_009872 [Ataeniobius toweri]|uniref:Uncharacterized protein n=1 Tax=Ataeniobius toweri TaxID=208326 RepID=A0ABU7AKY4_9TELE|nr:hypothetical protein [Ataeniobius toweri]